MSVASSGQTPCLDQTSASCPLLALPAEKAHLSFRSGCLVPCSVPVLLSSRSVSAATPASPLVFGRPVSPNSSHACRQSGRGFRELSQALLRIATGDSRVLLRFGSRI